MQKNDLQNTCYRNVSRWVRF